MKFLACGHSTKKCSIAEPRTQICAEAGKPFNNTNTTNLLSARGGKKHNDPFSDAV